jgi:hypothetical protein
LRRDTVPFVAFAVHNWLDNALDALKASQIMFIDRDDILNLYVVYPGAPSKLICQDVACAILFRLMERGEMADVPAGWYADPTGAPGQRYWDGSDWTLSRDCAC